MQKKQTNKKNPLLLIFLVMKKIKPHIHRVCSHWWHDYMSLIYVQVSTGYTVLLKLCSALQFNNCQLIPERKWKLLLNGASYRLHLVTEEMFMKKFLRMMEVISTPGTSRALATILLRAKMLKKIKMIALSLSPWIASN